MAAASCERERGRYGGSLFAYKGQRTLTSSGILYCWLPSGWPGAGRQTYVNRACETPPVPQVVRQPLPSGSLRFPLLETPKRRSVLGPVSSDCRRPGGSEEGDVPGWDSLKWGRGMGTVALKIGSILVSWSGGGPAFSSGSGNYSLLWRKGEGPPSPAWQGVATWQVPPGSLDWRWGKPRASLPPPLAHSGPDQSLATCRVGASGSWRTAGCCGGGVEGRKLEGVGEAQRALPSGYLLSAQPAVERFGTH